MRSASAGAMLPAMDVKLKYGGRLVTDADVALIQQLIKAHPTLSRRGLSQKLCEAWNWFQPNGQPRDMVCRGLMLSLHRAGHIELPKQRSVPDNPLARRRRPRTIEVDRVGLRGPLSSLGPIRFQQVRRTAEEPLLNSLIDQHHYLGYFLETFVDPQRFRGTCYRAANWMVLGRTTGRGKDDQTNRANRPIKQVLGYPLCRHFRRLLSDLS